MNKEEELKEVYIENWCENHFGINNFDRSDVIYYLEQCIDSSLKEGSKQTLKDELEFLKMEKEDIKQLKRDFHNEGYEIVDFVKDFINVRQERIGDREKELGEKE
jgi:hypothetical protein